MVKQIAVSDAEKLYEKGDINLMILNRQPHRCLLDLAKLYGVKRAGQIKREDLIAQIHEAHVNTEGAKICQNQFKQAIEEVNEMGIIPDVQDPAEVEAIAAEQENWVPTKPPLPDKRFDLNDTIVVRDHHGEHEELSQSFVDQLDKPRTSKGNSAKPKSVKAPAGKFTSDGGIEQRVKQMGIKTPQVLVCARAADTFDKPFTLQELADKADELGLVTRQGALFIVKYYLQKLLNAGLTVV